jgi:hypothetical protein
MSSENPHAQAAKEAKKKIDDAIQKRLALWKWPGGHVTPESTRALSASLNAAGMTAIESISTRLCGLSCRPQCLNHAAASAYSEELGWHQVPSRIHMLRYKHCFHVHTAINKKAKAAAEAAQGAAVRAEVASHYATKKIEQSPTHLTQPPTYYTTTIEMSSDNDDNRACGVHPHAQVSWRAKYEYMDKLWLQQKVEIADLQAQLTKKDTQLQVEIVEKKKVDAQILEIKAAAAAEIAELRVQLAKKDTQLEAEVLNINKETEAHRLKLEEAKKTNATKWASCFGCP